MPGPLPKPAAMRRRRNASPGAARLPATGREGKVPTLGKGYHPAARRWWRTVWSSPMATVYVDADVPALQRGALIVSLIAGGNGSATLMAELRHIEDRFGLSPAARRKLQWEIDQAGGAAEEPPAASSERRADLEARLRLVGS